MTTDTVAAEFDRNQFLFSLFRPDGTSISLDSIADTSRHRSWAPVRDDQDAGRWELQERYLGRTTTVHGVGESPASDLPLRTVSVGGYIATNWEAVEAWKASGQTEPLVPLDYIAWLKGLHVNQIQLGIDLSYDDSMDSTIEKLHTGPHKVTFPDSAIRQFIREFREHGIDVILSLALQGGDLENITRPAPRWQLGDPKTPEAISPEYWPWRPDHPNHEEFVAKFWETYTEQALHYARLAEEEGVKLFSLGTETDTLFRTRSDQSNGGNWPNHFRHELQTLVNRVRGVYSGRLTYDMHYTALTAREHYGTGSDHLWEDLDLDIVGVSAYFAMMESVPTTVTRVEEFERRYDEIFDEHLVPLAGRNPGRPVVFLEYGAIDTIEAPAAPGATAEEFRPFEFTDRDGNGLDDGRETQANMYQALLNTMSRYPGIIDGVVWNGVWIASDEKWAEHWGRQRGFNIRGRLAEDIVRRAYENWADWLTAGYWFQTDGRMNVVDAGAFVDAPELSGTPTLPDFGRATYRGSSVGGYGATYGVDHSEMRTGTQELGEYQGYVELVADFGAGIIGGRVHSISVGGLRRPPGGEVQPFAQRTSPWTLVLESVAFGANGFTGQTAVRNLDSSVGIAHSEGSWAGKFSTVSDSEDNPRTVGGTLGATVSTAGGTQASFIGAFMGSTQR